MEVYIKIYIKTAPTCFSAVTPSGSVLFDLAKVTVVKNRPLKYICVWLRGWGVAAATPPPY